MGYSRISRLKVNVGDTVAVVDRGTDRQVEDHDAAMDLLDLPAVDHHYVDDGFSASEFRTKEREAWPDLLAELETGTVGHVVMWVVDRIIRDPRDMETLLGLCKRHGVLLVQSGSLSVVDPRNPDAEMVLRIQGAVAAAEAAKASMRQKRKRVKMAENGVHHGGKRRFGYEPGMAELRDDEAAIVADLVTRFLAGESLHGLAKWLTAEGIPTPAGGKWTGPNLRHLLGRPHLAGLRVHHGEVVGKASWPAIIPVETHNHVVAKLADPDRATHTGGNARRWLLAGLMVCHECEAPTRARPRTGRNDAPAYYCSTGRHAHRSAEYVERIVVDAIVGRLSRMDANGLLADDAAEAEVIRLLAARDAVKERQGQYAALAATMTPEAYAAATNQLAEDYAGLDARVKVARGKVRQASRVLRGATGPRAAEAWAGFTLDRRRAIIAELADVSLRGGPQHRHATDVVVDFKRTRTRPSR